MTKYDYAFYSLGRKLSAMTGCRNIWLLSWVTPIACDRKCLLLHSWINITNVDLQQRMSLKFTLWKPIICGVSYCIDGLLCSRWNPYVPPGLGLKICMFLSHSVFLCSVWISEITAIISPYNVNWLVFITQTQGIYCAVRTGSLNITYVNIIRSSHGVHAEETTVNSLMA
jgi:hypothetical protein